MSKLGQAATQDPQTFVPVGHDLEGIPRHRVPEGKEIRDLKLDPFFKPSLDKAWIGK